MAAKVWSNVAVAIQSALATALTITGITKASPGVVTYTGTDPANGDYVLLLCNGMRQLNNRVLRVANVNAGGNTFELEGENTTNYNTFTTGTAEVITFGTALSTLTTVNASGGEVQPIDSTTIHDDTDQEINGNFTPTNFAFDSFWDPSDSGLAALKAATIIKASRAVKFTFADGALCLGYGAVACSLTPTGQAKGLVTTPVSFRMKGFVAHYAS